MAGQLRVRMVIVQNSIYEYTCFIVENVLSATAHARLKAVRKGPHQHKTPPHSSVALFGKHAAVHGQIALMR
jgi:hypothetical protein